MASKTTNFKKNNKKDKNMGVFIGSILILLVVVISFILAPALGDLAQANMGDIEFGSYGKEKITFSQLRNTPFQREIAQLTQNSTTQADYGTIRRAFNTTVAKSAAVDQFDKNGYVVTKEQLDEAVLESAVYDENGSFSPVLFKNTSESRKQEIKNEIERIIKIQSVENYTKREQKRSNAYLKFIASLSNKKRNFKYVTLEYKDYPDSLVAEYGKANSSKFTEYEISMLTVEKESKAKEIIKKLEDESTTFADLAKEFSIDNFKDKGGKVSGKVARNRLEQYLNIKDNALDNLKVGGEPVLIQGEENYILLNLDAEATEADFSIKDTVNKVRSYMLENERGIIEDYFIEQTSNINGNLLALGKEVKETGLFSLNYGANQLITSSINYVSRDPIFNKAVSNENFFETLFKLKKGAISEPIVLGDSISVFSLKEEVIEEPENSYIYNAISAILGNYKSLVSEDLILKSDNFEDKFQEGYAQITSGN